MSLKRFAYEYSSTRAEKEAEGRLGAFRSSEKELVEYSSDSGSDNELNQFVAKFSRARDRISERDVRKSDYESSRLQSRHQGDSFSFRRSPQRSELVGDSYRLRNPGDPSFKARPSSPIPGDDDSYEEDFVDDASKRIDPNLDSNGLPRYYIPDPNNPPPNLSSYSDPYYNRDKDSVKHRKKPEGRYNEYIEDDHYARQTTFRGESSKLQGEIDYYQRRFNEKYEYEDYGKRVPSSPPGSKEKDHNKRYYGEGFESQTRVSRPLSPTPEFSGARKKFCDSDLRNAPKGASPGIKLPEKLYSKDQPSYSQDESNIKSYPEKSEFGRNYYDSQEKFYNKDKPYPEGRNYSEKSDFGQKTDDRQEREKSHGRDKQYLREDRSVRHFSEKSDFGQRYDSKDKYYLREERSVRHFSEKSDLVRKYDSHEQDKLYYKDNIREYSREDQSVRRFSEKSDLNRKFDSPERDKMFTKDRTYSREDQIMKKYPEKIEFSQKYDSQDPEKHRSKRYREESQRYELNPYDVSKSERSSKNRDSGIQGGGVGKLSFDVDTEMGPPMKKRLPVRQKEGSPSLERVSGSRLSPGDVPYRRSSPPGGGYEYGGRKSMADTKRPALLTPPPSWAERKERRERYSMERIKSKEMIADVDDPDDMIPPPPPPPILSGLLHSPPPPTFQPTDYSQPLPHVSRSHPPSGRFDYVQAAPLNIEDPRIETIKKKIKESYIRKKASKGTFFPVSRKYKLSDNISPIIYTNFCALNYNKTKQPKTIIWESSSVRMLKMKGDPNYQKKGVVLKGNTNAQAANLEKEAVSLSEPKGLSKPQVRLTNPTPSEHSIELNQTGMAIPSRTTGRIGSNIASTSNSGITAPTPPIPSLFPQNIYQYQTGYYTAASTTGVVEPQVQNSMFPSMVPQPNLLNYFGFQNPNPLNYAPSLNPVFQSLTPTVTTTMGQVFQSTTQAAPAAALAVDDNWNSWNPKLVYPQPPRFPKVPSPTVISSKEKNKQNTNLIVCNQYPKPSSSEKLRVTSPKTVFKTQNFASETRSDNRSLISIPINNPIVNKLPGINEATRSYKPQQSKKPVNTCKDEDDDVVFISETYICKDNKELEPKVNLDNLIKSVEDKETKLHQKSNQNDKPSVKQSSYKSVQEVVHKLKRSEPNEAKLMVKMDNKNHPQKTLPVKEQDSLALKSGGHDSSKPENQNKITVKSSEQIKKPIVKSENLTTDKPNAVLKLNLIDKNKTTVDPPVTNQVPTKGSNIGGTSENSKNAVGSKPVTTKVTPVPSITVGSKITKINSSLSSETHESIVDRSDKAPKVLGETIAEPKEATVISSKVATVISSKVAEPEKLLDTQKDGEPKTALNDKIPIETSGETSKETVPSSDDKNKDDLDNRSIETKILVKSEVDLLQKIPFNMFEGPSELSIKISKVQNSKPSLFNITKSLNKASSYKNYSTCNGMLCFKFRPGDSPLIVTDCIGDEIISLVHSYMHGVTLKTFLDFFKKNFCEVREAEKKFEKLTKSCDVCLKLKKADSSNNCELKTNDGTQTAADEGDKQKTGDGIISKIKLIQSSSKIVEEISEKIKKKETDEYFFKGDLLLKKCFIDGNRELKIFLPDDKIDDIIKIYHSESLSHGPEDKVLTILKKHFSPVNDLLSSIKNCIENCDFCQKK